MSNYVAKVEKGRVAVHDIQNGAIRTTVHGPAKSAQITTDGKQVAVTRPDNTVAIHDISNGQLVRVLR